MVYIPCLWSDEIWVVLGCGAYTWAVVGRGIVSPKGQGVTKCAAHFCNKLRHERGSDPGLKFKMKLVKTCVYLSLCFICSFVSIYFIV